MLTLTDLLILVETDYIQNEHRSFKTGFIQHRRHLLNYFDGMFIAEQLTVTRQLKAAEDVKSSMISQKVISDTPLFTYQKFALSSIYKYIKSFFTKGG